VLGWGLLLFGVGALVVVVFRHAREHGILAPLLVGFVLRFVVMLIAHAGSLSLGDHGFLALDDQTYVRGGTRLAGFWSAGQVPDPVRIDIVGSYQFGYQLWLGILFTLGTTSVLLGKFVNVLLGTTSILVLSLLGGRLLGARARVRTAWVVALAPSLVWWSAPLLKEAMATLMIALGLLAITYLPRPRAIVVFGAVAAYLMLLRGPAALALVVGAGLAIGLAGRQVERKWLSRPFVAYIVTLLTGLVVVAAVMSRGNLGNLYHQYDVVVHRMIHQYQGGNPIRFPYDAIKSLVTPLPWVFDRGTENWDRALFPGVWVLMCSLPLAAVGAWRLRRRPEAWALLGTAATALSIDSVTSGFEFRQRSMVEPLILLLALAGVTSWRMAARTSSATLAVVAAAAGIQSRSPAVVALIAGAAAALLLLSRRLPSRPLDPPPDSPMVARFRESLGPADPPATSIRRRVVGEVARMARTVLGAAGAARTSLAVIVPRFEPGGDAGSGARERVWRRAPTAAAVLAFAVASFVVVPHLQAHGNARLATFDLNGGQPLRDLRTGGAVRRSPDGFEIRGHGSGSVAFTMHVPPARGGDRTDLLVWAGAGAAVSTQVSVVDPSGARSLLGSPGWWVAHRVDVTRSVGSGRVRVEFTAVNATSTRRLFADQVRVATYPPAAVPSAGRWEVAVWMGLAVLLVLVGLRRARRHAALVAFAGLAAFLVWPAVVSGALEPLRFNLWGAAVHASWLDLDRGLVSGTFGAHSALGVQLFHALTPVTGTGTTGARTAGLLVGILALAAIYALGWRIAGTVGAVAAATFALLSDPFRLSLSTGDGAGTLILASCLFLIAAHRVLVRGDARAMVALGAAGALAILAQPLTWPGVVVAVVLLALRHHAPRVPARAALAAGLLTLALVSLPARLSVAHQSAGEAAADVVQLASAASTADLGPRADGSPRDVGLTGYLFGEHSLSDVVKSTINGASEGLSAGSERPQTKLIGLIAFLAAVAGSVALLLLPRRRLLVLIPAMLALVPWFFATRGIVTPFEAEAVFFPVFAVGAAIVSYLAWEAIRQRLGRPPTPARWRGRASTLANRVGSRPEPASS
jgi:hypothetical protein